MAQTTVSVSGIPPMAIAQELVDFLEKIPTATRSVFACEIFTAHDKWKSRGAGRVQFETPAAAEEVLRRHADGRIGHFQGARLFVFRASDDIIARAVEPLNRRGGAVLHAGFLAGERKMTVLETWEDVRVELMPERQKMELFMVQEGSSYRLELMFGDIRESFLCSVGKGRETAILLRLRYAPRIYRRISGPTVKPRFKVDRYHFCKEDFQFRWIRSVDCSSSSSIARSSCFCLELPADSSEFDDAIRNLPLYRPLGEVIITREGKDPCSSEFPPIISSQPDRLPPLPYEIFFQLNYLVHAQKISLGQVDAELFHRISRLEADAAAQIIAELRRQRSTCFDPLKFIEDHLSNARRKTRSQDLPSSGLMKCHRALVTPSRVYLLGPELEASNYVIKHFATRASDFLRVSFVEEDWSKLPSDAISTRIEAGAFSEPYKTSIYRRILSVLRDGISIGEKKFEFLAFSASQLRGNSVWMFASGDDLCAEQIRHWMGRFNKIRSISKCAARMGQLFSSSIQTFDVLSEETETIQDVESSANGMNYCFSDGIGKISLPFARRVAEKCGLDQTPSAFQIRYGGYKGVVAVDRISGKKLSLRRSMLKFDSTSSMLSVTRWSESTPCHLNREIISLLSTLGVRDEVFEDLQRRHLRDLDEMLRSREAALKFLYGAVGGDARTATKMLNHGYEPSSEPYLSMILRARRDAQLSEMRSRCRIFVPRGRVLIGCLDESRALSYGQVYARVTMTSTEVKEGERSFFRKIDAATAAVIGKVIVTKNPCLHPGDIRVLDAVYDPVLEETGLVDCIVFPQRGKRPHPSECSGGDLDGDQFFVCWDENLIPPTTDEPMDYLPRRPRIMDHEVTLEEIQSFFVDYMVNDTLGAISTAHLVHADRDANKARSAACRQLAKLHSAAVDFAKTGSPAEMPKSLKPKEFPDFVERSDKPTYPSRGVLGKLFRGMISKLCDDDRIAAPSVNYDFDLQVNGFESYVEEARIFRDLYAGKLRDLMDYFGATSEEEILTGNLRSRSTHLRTDRRKYAEVKDRISAAVAALQAEAGAWLRDGGGEDQAKMASAWYHVTYHEDCYVPESTFLSFPWAACDVLLRIKSQKQLQSR